jgi:hypothetical protein
VAIAITALLLVGLLAYLLFLGEWRVALAFVIAPLAAPIIGILETRNSLTFMFISGFSYPLSLLLGIPAYLLFRYLGWLQLWSVLLASAILGGTVALTLFGGVYDLGRTALFSAFGAVNGLVFWLIAFASLRSNQRLERP